MTSAACATPWTVRWRWWAGARSRRSGPTPGPVTPSPTWGRCRSFRPPPWTSWS